MPERRLQRRLLVLTALTGLTCILLVEIGAGLAKRNAPNATSNAKSPVFITLERTACLGFCPVYLVSVTGDGTVTFQGRQFVQQLGTHVGHVDPAQVQALIEEFYRIGYFDLQDEYSADITDAPTTITSLTIGAQFKRVLDYVAGPKELKLLEDRIDEVAQTSQWIGDEDERLKVR
jgi:Domain of unknown function (DUF6438)